MEYKKQEYIPHLWCTNNSNIFLLFVRHKSWYSVVRLARCSLFPSRVGLRTYQHPGTFKISYRILIRMRNVSEKNCRENQNTHFTFNNFFFRCHSIYETMWTNTIEPGRPQMTIWRMCFACWMTNSTSKHSKHAVLIAFPRQQWLR